MSLLPCEIVETQSDITSSVIWLHGLGASGHDFVPIVPHLQLPAELGVRFVFPHARSIPITINGGMVMPAWYDILSMDIEREIDTQQIMDSAAAIEALIEREIEKGIPSEKIVLAGFSQGGAVAYQVALSFPKKLGGLMAMSTYFATHKTVELNAENSDLPIHIFHGSADSMVPEAMGKHALEALKAKNFVPEYKTYPMQHEVCLEEITDASAFLQKVLL